MIGCALWVGCISDPIFAVSSGPKYTPVNLRYIKILGDIVVFARHCVSASMAGRVAICSRVLGLEERYQWRIQKGDEGMHPPTGTSVVSECHTVLALLQSRDRRREPFIHYSGLTSKQFPCGFTGLYLDVRGCIYDVAFPPPRFSSSSSRRRCC